MALPDPAPEGRPATWADIAPCVGRYGDEEGNVFAVIEDDGRSLAAVPEQPELKRCLVLGDGRFVALHDREVEYHFSDLRDGRYQALAYASPLWPTERFSRL